MGIQPNISKEANWKILDLYWNFSNLSKVCLKDSFHLSSQLGIQ